jgi:hypothetical protein
MREERSSTWKGLWASISEGRPPEAAEIEDIAAKIWRDIYGRDALLAWDQVEAGSPPHRKSFAAALAALGVPSRR